MKHSRTSLLILAALLAFAGRAVGQNPEESDLKLARRGFGVRGGPWHHLPYVEIFFQRGLAERVALENSAGVWQRRQAESRTYVIPLLTSLKVYPLTNAKSRIEPYVLAGVGFGLGIENESDRAVGGGGTNIVTGFGLKTAAGLEIHVVKFLSAHVGGQYLYMRFNDKLANQNTFEGTGFEGGLTFLPGK